MGHIFGHQCLLWGLSRNLCTEPHFWSPAKESMGKPSCRCWPHSHAHLYTHTCTHRHRDHSPDRKPSVLMVRNTVRWKDPSDVTQ